MPLVTPPSDSWFVSLDDHVIEPPTLWTDRLPSKYRDIGPRVIREQLQSQETLRGVEVDGSGKWADVWAYEDLRRPIDSTFAAISFGRDEFQPGPMLYEQMRPGCYDSRARLADMDRNNTIASLCFPTICRFCGQAFYEAKDKDLALLCVKAFNDWMIEEWCASTGGRLLPLTLIPLWDPSLAAEEVRRNAARGARAIAFSELPTRLGLPSIHDKNGYWEPLFAACEETATSIAIHVGSSSQLPRTSDDAPPAVTVALVANNATLSLVDFLWSGVLERYPGLNLMYSEGQIGWIPFVLERCDKIWNTERQTSARGRSYHEFYKMTSSETPSFYYYRQVYGVMFDDDHGLRSIDAVGEDNVLFEVDYPHADSTWPNTQGIVRQIEDILTPAQAAKVLRENAGRLFDIPSLPSNTGA